MAGGLPELVTIPGHHITISPYTSMTIRGCHPKESSETWAWFDHIIAMGGAGDWAGLRPVLDKWPRQQWTGFQASLVEPSAETLQKIGPLADLLLTQFDWSGLEVNILTVLEPAITALREGHKKESRAVLAKLLQQDAANEPVWLLMAAALDDPAKQRESVQRALALNPHSEVGHKLAALLKDPPRIKW